MSRVEKIWEIAPIDHERVSLLAKELDLPKPLAAILLDRGVETRAQAERFFSPSLADLPSPFLMKGMKEAVAVVLQALARQAPVIVYGDYDVDGTTGVALLFLFMNKIGFSESYACQPHRLLEGYGLHLKAIRRTVPPGVLDRAPLVITVDCGISNHIQVQPGIPDTAGPDIFFPFLKRTIWLKNIPTSYIGCLQYNPFSFGVANHLVW